MKGMRKFLKNTVGKFIIAKDKAKQLIEIIFILQMGLAGLKLTD